MIRSDQIFQFLELGLMTLGSKFHEPEGGAKEDQDQQSIPSHSCTWLMGTMYAMLVELGPFRLNHLILPLLEVTLLEDNVYDWTINVSILIYVFHLILFIP